MTKSQGQALTKSKKKSGQDIQLKDALHTIAKAKGFDSWRELTANYEETDLFNPAHWSAQWKTWFGKLEEARSHLTGDHFLLPYHKQFFICDLHYIKALGISEEDMDLISVGNDWTNPQDPIAWKRIIQKIRKAQTVK